MSLLNLDAIRSTPVETEPFPYLIAGGAVSDDARDAVIGDYPKIAKGGSFPISSLEAGPTFDELAHALRDEPLRDLLAEQLQIDLTDRPTTLTVRGRCRLKDGKIHTDSRSKLVTVLLYLNEPWQADGGRLRLLRSGDNLEDVIVEAPPHFGTMIAFRNDENAWHGHAPFDGVRRTLQLNYVVDEAAAKRSERRHGLSAMLKRYNPFAKKAA